LATVNPGGCATWTQLSEQAVLTHYFNAANKSQDITGDPRNQGDNDEYPWESSGWRPNQYYNSHTKQTQDTTGGNTEWSSQERSKATKLKQRLLRDPRLAIMDAAKVPGVRQRTWNKSRTQHNNVKYSPKGRRSYQAAVQARTNDE
jgi:hypothetical protein